MIQIHFPIEKPSIKKENNRLLIFCPVRKKWLVLTPEEWVRQNIILYLTIVKNYPNSIISVEKQIIVNNQKKRFDIAVFKNESPFLLVECKNMEESLNPQVLSQSLSYLSSLNAKYLIASNGTNTLGYEKVNDQLMPITEIPAWV